MKEPVVKYVTNDFYLTYNKKDKKDKKDKKEILGEDYFYGNLNFIFFKEKLYLFVKPVFFGYFCGNGIDLSKPINQNITPDSLIEINDNNFEKVFYKHSLLIKSIENYSSDLYNYTLNKSVHEEFKINISIALDKDTIRGLLPQKIIKFLKVSDAKIIVVRKLTEEEFEVSKSKYYMYKYDINKIKWKIGFNNFNLHKVKN